MKGRPGRRKDVLWRLSPWLPSLCRHALRDFPKSARDNWVLNPQRIFFHLPFFALSLLPLLHFPPSFLPSDHICLDISLRLRGGCINTCVRIKCVAAHQAKWKNGVLFSGRSRSGVCFVCCCVVLHLKIPLYPLKRCELAELITKIARAAWIHENWCFLPQLEKLAGTSGS